MPPQPTVNDHYDLKWILPLVFACIAVYANTVGGDFVYDDLRQIVRNPLIQKNELIWQALTSDVWAFKGDGTTVASNYWRPTFTAWHILIFRLFGAEPAGWHVTNILLHTVVCLLIFALLRSWRFERHTAFVVALLFAVHPVHVESVAWISGSPDLLFAVTFLASLWLAQKAAETGSRAALASSIFLYLLSLGSKELATLCFPIYFFVFRKTGESASRASVRTLPFALAAGAYFLLRWTILGAISRPQDEALSLPEALLTIPKMFVFYLRQVFAPVELGANYTLEPVVSVADFDFVLPLILSAAFLLGTILIAKRVSKGVIAALMFLLPLLPAMNAAAFPQEQLVHDRYLYLPLLGVVMLIATFAAKYVRPREFLIGGIVIASALGFQTISYNRAWASDLSLWSHTRRVDNSPFTSMQYASTLLDAGRYDEAAAEFSMALEKRRSARALLGRGRAFAMLGKWTEAENDLRAIVTTNDSDLEAYALYQAYEGLGIVYQGRGEPRAAISSFEEARQRLPIYSAAITANLAVALYQSGDKQRALTELETARSQARRELLPESKDVFLRLGMLYLEIGRRSEARTALQEFLDSTSGTSDRTTMASRANAVKLIQQIR